MLTAAKGAAPPASGPRLQNGAAGGAFLNHYRKSTQPPNCVVGLAGLEPPTRPLWRDAPAPRTPQWDIFDWPGQEERACDVGSTVDTSMAVPEPGVFRASGSGAPAWRH